MEFLSKPWSEITRALRNAQIRVAVTPYLNGEAYKLLPLRDSDDVLVVDACERNVRAGLTNPHQIEKFRRKGVRCYTVADLHAKVYRADKNLFVGSTNASTHSRDTLVEACLQVRSSEIIEQFDLWLNSLVLVPLTRKDLQRLEEVYSPPRWPVATSRRHTFRSWVTWVGRDDDSEETEEFAASVAKESDMEEDDIYTVSLPRSERFTRLLARMKPGDEVFVIDRRNRKGPLVNEPMRLIAWRLHDDNRYRLALEQAKSDVPLKGFAREARQHYAGFPMSGKSHRGIKPEAAAALRKLF